MTNAIYTLKEIDINSNSIHKYNSKDNYTIFYFRKGHCISVINEETYSCTNHNYILLKDYEEVYFNNNTDSICTIYALSFNPNIDLNSIKDESLLKCFNLESLNKFRHIPSHSEGAMRIRTLLVLLLVEDKNNHYASNTFKINTLSMILVILNRVVIESMMPEKKFCKKGLRLDHVFTYVNAHLTEDISLDKLSEDLFFSKYYILHEFKKKTGISLYKYIIKRKLEYSKTLIESGMPIKEVYHHCGFGDYSNFFKVFKREYGLTPKQYYNQVINKNILADLNVELNK
ncbi:helix-turn-helix transcriptional regulator [Clostridium sp. NSJ-6]|uniref:Helix-turn-helix transcriptional regulator n=1 Tax=Clostridium hominis TaxID=2763036 RepID=A0ABR7DA77_9CLOT|nr:AraC family transcriptional regulator [Clostridium hominis]MBC5628299.1 helix-turn-helix transcriptional regulator [Clostridium hominis]MDU2671475.1 AraC family transcriptional regulator [Clostridium sp.]